MRHNIPLLRSLGQGRINTALFHFPSLRITKCNEEASRIKEENKQQKSTPGSELQMTAAISIIIHISAWLPRCAAQNHLQNNHYGRDLHSARRIAWLSLSGSVTHSFSRKIMFSLRLAWRTRILWHESRQHIPSPPHYCFYQTKAISIKNLINCSKISVHSTINHHAMKTHLLTPGMFLIHLDTWLIPVWVNVAVTHCWEALR